MSELTIAGLELIDLAGENSPLLDFEIDYDVENDYDLLGDDSVVQLSAVTPDGGTRPLTEELEELFWSYDGPDGGLSSNQGMVYVYAEGSYQIYASINGIQSNPLEFNVIAPELEPEPEFDPEPEWEPEPEPELEAESEWEPDMECVS